MCVCVCGKNLNVKHALTCPTGGLHNDIRDLTTDLMAEVCDNICTEPELQPLSGEALQGRFVSCQEGARVDIRAESFWEQSQTVFFDIRVFNPFAPSNLSQNLSATYQQHEKLKRRDYEQQIQEVEHGSFTPIILSATGGMASAAQVTFKRMVSMLATKPDQPLHPSDECCMMHTQLLADQATNPVHQRLRIDHGSCCQDRPNLYDCQRGVCPPNLNSNYSSPN